MNKNIYVKVLCVYMQKYGLNSFYGLQDTRFQCVLRTYSTQRITLFSTLGFHSIFSVSQKKIHLILVAVTGKSSLHSYSGTMKLSLYCSHNYPI